MKPSELAFYLPADQEMLVIYPYRGSSIGWSNIRFRGTSEQFLDSFNDDDPANDVVSIDVVSDGELIVVVCDPMGEEDETNE